MPEPPYLPPPPDQAMREQALDPDRSFLVQAPAGSGKTDLLTRRFLRLLAEVETPGEIVAITFTKAAAAEMRNRILDELKKADANPDSPADAFSLEAIARRALKHSQALGWQLLDLPAQLRISTIDSFCYELALQQPLLSGLGGVLEITEQPENLYRRAARETLKKVDQIGSELARAIETLLEWRDNGWQEMEDLLVEMLASRDRWMQGFLLDREPDWRALRERLERPFLRSIATRLASLNRLLDKVPGARSEALALARFACGPGGCLAHREFAELAEFPAGAPADPADFETALRACSGLAALLLTDNGSFRRQVDKRLGFPAGRKQEKERLLALIAALAAVPGLETALGGIRALPPPRYPEEDWKIIRSCFTLLRHAAGELRVAFAEAGAVDFTEVAQIAQRVLRDEDGLPSDAALAVADGIRHLLVDEFQDTSRRQHQLLASLIAAWPDRAGRTCFLVGDPMQSIYFFRDADAELFPRVRRSGLEISRDEPLLFEFVSLQANFRSVSDLVERLNRDFAQIFAPDDGSGIPFSAALPVRQGAGNSHPAFALHLDFVPSAAEDRPAAAVAVDQRETASQQQIAEIVALIRQHRDSLDQARQARERGENGKFRIAVLGRARRHLVPVAAALREAGIPFRALELEELAARPEVLDALALAHALFNPEDRVAWLGVLRAPWCGLSLDDIHALAGDPDAWLRPVPELLKERIALLSATGQKAVLRVREVLDEAATLRSVQPAFSLGTWLEQVWLRLGGALCVDAAARTNLHLLWECLDQLRGGEPDLLGPGLDAALGQLAALPDPGTSSVCGVQLMTIHKAKGLEFEMVIVPELQTPPRTGRTKMLSWLERGLAQPDESGELTEFLVAPFQPRGVDRGRAKQWVDQVCRERELQESRRILYVAATRARDELHLFARLSCKTGADGSFTLTKPAGSLLATAWPALEADIHERFEAWKNRKAFAEKPESGVIVSIAASDEKARKNLRVLPPSSRPKLGRRLKPEAQPAPSEAASSALWKPNLQEIGTGSGPLYARHEGGLMVRALGTAVHWMLEELAGLRATLEWPAARAALAQLEPRAAAQARAAGLAPSQAAHLAAQALRLAMAASEDPVGAWILSPHPGAASESGWSGVFAGTLRTVRPDRIFRAGSMPCSEEGNCWWIIDYKTSHADLLDPESDLPALRQRFAPQIEVYVQLLRRLQGLAATDGTIRVGLYYPRLPLLDWWKP
ncbi:MAG: UvrD-helicase domain-containing protein [Terracidiphilus sp.]